MVDTMYGEKVDDDAKEVGAAGDTSSHDVEQGTSQHGHLSRNLQGRHMQMIAIGMMMILLCVAVSFPYSHLA